MSPPSGRSTLMISAPRSARIIAQYGPAKTRERSRTRTPFRGPSIGAAIVISAVERLDDQLEMLAGLDLMENVFDQAIRADDER